MEAYAVIAFVLGLVLVPIVAVGTGLSAIGIVLAIVALSCIGASSYYFSTHGM